MPLYLPFPVVSRILTPIIISARVVFHLSRSPGRFMEVDPFMRANRMSNSKAFAFGKLRLFPSCEMLTY